MIEPTFIVQRSVKEWDTPEWEPDEDQPIDTTENAEWALNWLLQEVAHYPEYGEMHNFRIVERHDIVRYNSDEIERRLK